MLIRSFTLIHWDEERRARVKRRSIGLASLGIGRYEHPTAIASFIHQIEEDEGMDKAGTRNSFKLMVARDASTNQDDRQGQDHPTRTRPRGVGVFQSEDKQYDGGRDNG
jgi:hypothetical protein